MQEVSLAQPGSAVDEERVVGLGGLLRDGDRCGMRESIGRADDESVEGVLRVETTVFTARRHTVTARAGRPHARSVDYPIEGVRLNRIGGVGHCVDLVLTGGCGDAGVHSDSQAHLTAELGGERRGDDGAQSRLEDVLREVVGSCDQSGVLDKPEGACEGDEGPLLGGEGAVTE